MPTDKDAREIYEDIYKDATIKELDNGYYEIDDGNVVTYGPKYITPDTIVTSYLPGKDGATNDAKVLVATMTGNNPPNSLVTIAKGDYDNVALDMLLNTTAAVEKATGKSAPVINGEAFSAHTGTQLAALNDYLKTHPNANVTYSCIDPTSGLNDAVYTEGWLEEHADLLKKYDVPINVVFGPYDTTKVAYEVLEKYDLNVRLIVPENRSPGNADGHWKTNEAFLGGLSWYLAGISDEDFSELYKVYKGKYSDKEIYDIFTRKGIIVPGGYKIPPIEPVKLSGLNSFSTFSRIGGSYTTSDLQFIKSSMNSIRDSIAKSEIVNSSPNLGIQGATGLMSAISSCMASFNGMTAILYDKIKQETEATMSIAQGIIDMDRNVAENAEQLAAALSLGEGSRPMPKPPAPTQTAKPSEIILNAGLIKTSSTTSPNISLDMLEKRAAQQEKEGKYIEMGMSK